MTSYNYDPLLWKYIYNICVDYEKTRLISTESYYLGIDIGDWFKQQQDRFNQSTLTINELKYLKKLKSWDDNMTLKTLRYQLSWNHKYNLCVEYEEKHTIIHETIYQDVCIGTWVHTQRSYQLARKLSDAKLEKMKKLKVWKWRYVDFEWKQRFKACVKYSRKAEIRSNSKCHGFHIGKWLHKQKSNFRLRKLSEDRLNVLNTWDVWNEWVDTQFTWMDYLNMCIDYIKETGNIEINSKYKGILIGKWFRQQLSLKECNMMLPTQLFIFDNCINLLFFKNELFI